MTLKELGITVLVATCIALFLSLPGGCFLAGEKVEPGVLPPKTVLYDADGNGVMESLAYDRDGDGRADVQDGQVQIVPNSKKLVAAIAADTKGPELLAWIGGAAGIPGAAALAALWRKKRWARGLLEVVQTVQKARGELDEPTLATVDTALSEQSQATQDLVKAVKKANGIKSVAA